MTMTGARGLLAITLSLALVTPAFAAKRPKYGVFGKINGKKFKARSSGKSDDACVFGRYMADGGLILTAGECGGEKQERAPRKDYAQVLFVCLPDGPPKTPPYEVECAYAGYAEALVKKGHATDMKVWVSSVGQTSGVRLTVESFDGTYAKGTFSGTFDVPETPGLSAARVGGQVRFLFPVKAVE